MAFAHPAIRRRSLDQDVALVRQLCDAEGAGVVVLGLPLNMDGSEGAEAAAVRRFGDALVVVGLHVTYEDERLTSWEAGQRLRQAGTRPDRASGELDSAAARLILQQYLDAGHSTRPPEETE